MRFSPNLALLCCSLTSILPLQGSDQIRATILDGRNNHDWVGTTDSLRATLESTGRFLVETETAPQMAVPKVPRSARSEEEKAALAALRTSFDEPIEVAREAFKAQWDAWQPDFSKTDVIVFNYNGPDWSAAMREAFLDYVREGGGLVVIHGANNPFRNWVEFNEMIGLGWRPAPIGRAIKIDPETGETFVADDLTLSNQGNSGHGSKHPFEVTVRASQHPVMRGLPKSWLHAKDELYHHMRGPAHNLTILSSAWSDPDQRGTGLHEPLTWEVACGKGRVIVTTMGHLWPGDLTRGEGASLKCVGFQTVFARSCGMSRPAR
ncbi:MAG: ThuA domain-containing protein [Verrucomicrobiota bacterium]